MKKSLLLLSLLILASCASHSPLPEEKGTVCINPPKEGETVARCYPARLYLDPTRFHYLRPWQQNSLGEMPDLP
jgi:hypothetical protein